MSTSILKPASRSPPEPKLISTTLVSQFLLQEKSTTRGWLLCEMDQLLDQLFDQLTEKFEHYIQRSTTSENNTNNNNNYYHYDQAETIDSEEDEDNFESLEATIPINSNKAQKPKQTIILVSPTNVPLKDEEEDLEDEFEASTSGSGINYISPEQQLNIDPNELSDNEEDNSNLLIDLTEDEDENSLEANLQSNPQSDNNHNIDNDYLYEGTIRTGLRKRSRISGTSNGNKAKVQSRPKNQDKHIATLELQCPELNCEELFQDRDQIDEHLKVRHHIEKYRCMERQCSARNVSFDNKLFLGNHINTVHATTTRWRCSRCHKNFSTYPVLYDHFYKYHQYGQFACTYPTCSFTGDSKVKMYIHQSVHNAFVCHFEGCEYRTRDSNRLKSHERKHLGIKPYRCKWPGCEYTSNARHGTMQHIMRVHLKIRQFKKEEGLGARSSRKLDPRDYLEVVNDLL